MCVFFKINGNVPTPLLGVWYVLLGGAADYKEDIFIAYGIPVEPRSRLTALKYRKKKVPLYTLYSYCLKTVCWRIHTLNAYMFGSPCIISNNVSQQRQKMSRCLSLYI